VARAFFSIYSRIFVALNTKSNLHSFRLTHAIHPSKLSVRLVVCADIEMILCDFFFENFLELELSPLFSPWNFFSLPRKYERLEGSLLKRVQGGFFGKNNCQASFLLYKLLTVQILQYTIFIYTTPSWVG